MLAFDLCLVEGEPLHDRGVGKAEKIEACFGLQHQGTQESGNKDNILIRSSP